MTEKARKQKELLFRCILMVLVFNGSQQEVQHAPNSEGKLDTTTTSTENITNSFRWRKSERGGEKVGGIFVEALKALAQLLLYNRINGRSCLNIMKYYSIK